MKFFDRKQEIAKLRRIEDLSYESAQFTIISGRRRVGKTTLVKEAYRDTELLYFFVARKAEPELCADYVNTIVETMDVPVMGEVKHFADVFRWVMQMAQTRHITLLIDEFQEFININAGIFSEMQNIWDQYKSTAKINLLVSGSVNSLINRIFRDKKEPLYGRQTDTIVVHTFTPSVLKEILSEYSPNYTQEDLLAFYLFTGGVAKYVELLVDSHCLTMKQMMDAFFERDSYFLGEGKAMLIEEFGKDYANYFSILSLIASGYNTRSKIEDCLGMEISGFLKKLLDDYELIKKQQPIFEKAQNKNVHYILQDHFLRIWFRFIYKYSYIIEAGGYERLKQIFERDYTTYSGIVLEDWFRDALIESGNYTRIGYWHDRKGENEIDLIAADDVNKQVTFYEIKRQEKEIDLAILRAKEDVFLKTTGEYHRYQKNSLGLSLKDM